MFDTPGGFRVMHWHGGDSWVPMTEGEHDVARHDPERGWLKGARIFKCSTCDEQIAIAPEGQDGGVDQEHPHPAM